MKLFFQLALAFALAPFLLTSCDPAKEFEAELNTVDSCLTELNKLDSLYKGIEFDSLTLMVKHIKQNESKMKKYYSSDTINMELGVLMNNSKGIRKSLKNIGGFRKDARAEIDALRLQFTNLRTDIVNGVLDKEQVKEYLAKEKDDLEKLNLSFMDFYNNQELQASLYYQTVPKVDEYVKQLNIPPGDTLVLEDLEDEDLE
jgi:hypothetical protein